MTDRMTTSWADALYFEEGGDALFDQMKAQFIKQNELARLKDLEVVDSWLQNEDRPTRQAASLLDKIKAARGLA